MTLIPYNAARLDEMAVRLFDLAAVFRQMAVRSRVEAVPQLDLHDKKAQEWLGRLEAWTAEAAHRFELSIVQNRGAKRAQALAENDQPSAAGD
jgi:hypothetical protein